jgi:PAS domain S-box-containing protein
MFSSDREVSERAYAAWARNGRPAGICVGDWLEAEAELTQVLRSEQARQLGQKAPPEASQLLQAVLENSTAIVYVKDLQGRYLLISRRYETLFGVSQEQLAGRTDYDVFPKEVADAVRANDSRVLATRTPLEFEEVVPHGDVMHTYISLKFPISGPSGAPYAVCGISTDITARKHAEFRLLAEHAVAQTLAQSVTLADAVPSVLQTVCDCFGWEVALFWGVDRRANLLRCVEIWHDPALIIPAFDQFNRQTAFSLGVGLPGRVWASGLPEWVADVGRDADCLRAPIALAEGLHAACGFPVKNGGEPLGVIEVFSRAVRQPDADVRGMMSSVGSQVSQFAERRQAEKALYEREKELSLARAIQQRRLPRAAPALAGFDIGCASHPAQETGGDSLDFIPMPGDCLGIAVGDASGHGIAAALLMAETRAYLRALARTDRDVGKVLAQVNRHVAEDAGEDFVTLVLARLDPRTRSLAYSSAGHLPVYVLDSRGEVRTTLRSTALPLGLDAAGAFPGTVALTLAPGDLVLLLTDGITEAFSPDGRLFGMGRVLSSVRAHQGRSAAGIVAALFDEVHAFSQGPQADDMTAVVIKVSPA